MRWEFNDGIIIDTSDFDFRSLFQSFGLEDEVLEKALNVTDRYAREELEALNRPPFPDLPLFNEDYYTFCKQESRRTHRGQSSGYLTFKELTKVAEEETIWTLIDLGILENHSKWPSHRIGEKNTPYRISVKRLHEFEDTGR